MTLYIQPYLTGNPVPRRPVNQEPQIEPLKDIQEAAEILRRSHWTIRRDVRAGKIRCIRLGRRILFEPAELRRLIAQSRGDLGTPNPGANVAAKGRDGEVR